MKYCKSQDDSLNSKSLFKTILIIVFLKRHLNVQVSKINVYPFSIALTSTIIIAHVSIEYIQSMVGIYTYWFFQWCLYTYFTNTIVLSFKNVYILWKLWGFFLKIKLCGMEHSQNEYWSRPMFNLFNEVKRKCLQI